MNKSLALSEISTLLAGSLALICAYLFYRTNDGELRFIMIWLFLSIAFRSYGIGVFLYVATDHDFYVDGGAIRMFLTIPVIITMSWLIFYIKVEIRNHNSKLH